MIVVLKKISCLIFMFQVFTSQSYLFSQVPVKDQITDTVRCRKSIEQSYALFLPAQYDSIRSWPLILIFDPGARGRTGVNTFIEAGRKYGFILACSNNSQNGPIGENFTAAAAMLNDIEERFNINKKMIYVSGFSGGSRVALALAAIDNNISGVIGCGAGLPNFKNLLPSHESSFLYYGLAGTRDMNYIEMHDLYDFFNSQTNVISYLRTFPGDHQWPTPDLIIDAVEWLLFQSMNRSIIQVDQTFISYLEDKTQALINSTLSAGNRTDAARYLRLAIRDFGGTTFATGLQQSLSELEKSPEYRKANLRWDRMVANEAWKKEKFLGYLGVILSSGSVSDSVPDLWKNEIRSLISLRDKGSPENSQMASRLLNFIPIICSDQGISSYRKKYYDQATKLFEICILSDSENPVYYFYLAKSLVQSGNFNESVSALSEAVNHGIIGRQQIESDTAFRIIRNNPRYKELILKMNK